MAKPHPLTPHAPFDVTQARAWHNHSGGSTGNIGFYAQAPHYGDLDADLRVEALNGYTGEQIAAMFAQAPRALGFMVEFLDAHHAPCGCKWCVKIRAILADAFPEPAGRSPVRRNRGKKAAKKKGSGRAR
jgi:hypothetical protein